MDTLPKTLVEAIKFFSDEGRAHDFVVGMRWKNGVVCCPRCGSLDVHPIPTRRTWECHDCTDKRQFSVRIGTIFEDSKLPLSTWLIAIWLVVNAKNGISSYELARSLGITQKSAWHLGHRIRMALNSEQSMRKLFGQVEADETFIGGRARNMHTGRRKVKGSGIVGKTVVLGLLQRHGEVRAMVVSDTRRRTLQGKVREHVNPGSQLYTDAHAGYAGLSSDFAHQFIDHAEKYVEGAVHTNSLENFWSLLKRSIHGTYICPMPFHLFRYLDEQAWRFNARKVVDSDRFIKALGTVGGKRLTYATLTAKEANDGKDSPTT